MNNKQYEALIFANDRPTSISDDLYQWSIDAEEMIRRQHARIVELEKENNYLNDGCAELEAHLAAAPPVPKWVVDGVYSALAFAEEDSPQLSLGALRKLHERIDTAPVTQQNTLVDYKKP